MGELAKFTFPENGSARDALQLFNEIAIPNMAIFILNENKQLIGSLTDGDIRRGLLNGLNIDAPVNSFMNAASKYFVEEENNFEKVNIYREDKIRFVPIVDAQLKIIRIVDLEKLHAIIPADAVLMAGGEGKRLRPLTEKTPKSLLKVGEKPIIEHNVDRLVQVGIKNMHISINYLGEQLENYFGNGSKKNINIKYIKETKPMGTIGSILLADNFEHDDILVMNSDLLTNIDFTDFYKTFRASNADMAVAATTYSIDVPYAVLEIDMQQRVRSLKEKPRYTYFSNAGIYLLKKNVLNLIPKNAFFHITDLMDKVLAMDMKLITFPINGYWLDIGKHEDYQKAQEDIKHLRL